MTALKVIAFWGIASLVAAIAGGVLAAIKRRDHSAWAAWCFVLPPLLFILLFVPTNPGPRPRRPSMDEDDRRSELV